MKILHSYNSKEFCIKTGMLLIILCAFQLFAIKAHSQDKTAIIHLEFSEEVSGKFISAQINELIMDSIGAPVQYADIHFYVQRTFSLLPIGELYNFTDENGVAIVEFPSDLPGDSIGDVTIVVKLEDDDNYSDLDIRENINWGIPTYLVYEENVRSLSAAGENAPISLLILVNSLIAAVWGVMIYIVFKVYKISKM
jgi:hypothetical protein